MCVNSGGVAVNKSDGFPIVDWMNLVGAAAEGNPFWPIADR